MTQNIKLHVGIVGCGIAGLSAALALSKAEHDIEIFEKSNFSDEVGAAIMTGPNATRILNRWNFDFEQAGALDCNQMRRIKADTLVVDSVTEFKDMKEIYGARWWMFHRADLHSTLRELVKKENPKPRIHLGKRVSDVDADSGTIKFADGSTIEKDLVIIADGAHSELIAKVIGRDSLPTRSPVSMYRFLQPRERILSKPQAAGWFIRWPPGVTAFYKTAVGRPGLLLNVYQCRRGELFYVALVHPTKPQEKGITGWDSPASYSDMMEDAQGFSPSVTAICEGATDIRVFNQMWRDPVDRLVRGRALLLGDAGHLMLPTHGQGAAMAIEDAAGLEVLFGNIESKTEVYRRLEMWSRLRLERIQIVQTMSNKMVGPKDKMMDELRKYTDGPLPSPEAMTFSTDYNNYFFQYDVTKEAETLLRSVQ